MDPLAAERALREAGAAKVIRRRLRAACDIDTVLPKVFRFLDAPSSAVVLTGDPSLLIIAVVRRTHQVLAKAPSMVVLAANAFACPEDAPSLRRWYGKLAVDSECVVCSEPDRVFHECRRCCTRVCVPCLAKVASGGLFSCPVCRDARSALEVLGIRRHNEDRGDVAAAILETVGAYPEERRAEVAAIVVGATDGAVSVVHPTAASDLLAHGGFLAVGLAPDPRRRVHSILELEPANRGRASGWVVDASGAAHRLRAGFESVLACFY